jgi:hypothetical protein
MIRSKSNVCVLFLLLSAMVTGQDLESLESAYRAFEYEKVIEMADTFLVNEDSLDQQTKIKIFHMRAIAEYSLNQQIDAEKSFISILDLDYNFSLSKDETSPKIINFFEKIKSAYEPKMEDMQQETTTEIDSTLHLFRSAIARSLLLPGLGHLHLEQKKKALLLGVPASATLISGVYYIFLTSKKEKEYLNETDVNKIETLYKSYNSSYKTRNILIISYALIWIYSQYDLIANGEEYLSKRTGVSISPVLKQGYVPQLAVRINL